MLDIRKNFSQEEQGFTLVEVLVAILIITLFVTISMEAMVVAALMKARARQYAEATTWIQQDLENLKQQAAILGSTTLSSSAASGATSLTVNSTLGFFSNYRLQVSGTSGSPTVHNIASISGNTITVTQPLSSTQPAGTTVSVIATGSISPTTNPIGAATATLCYANAAADGFGTLLSNNLPVVPSETSNTTTPNVGTKTILGGSYTLTRTPSIRSVSRFSALSISYTVAPTVTSGTAPTIAKLEAEEVPRAFFQCPPF